MKQTFLMFYVLFHLILFVNTLYKIDNLSGFKCYTATNISTPLRLTQNNDIECFSLDGKKCFEENDEAKCVKFVSLNIKKIKPLVCKKEQYNDKNHHCYKGKKFFFKQWKCFEHTGIEAAVRINKKTSKIECLSNNGKKCVQGKKALTLCKMKGKLKAIPLVCGRNTLNNHDTLCREAFAWFKYTGEWICKNKTNINTPIRLAKDGSIECLSKEGKECIWEAFNDKKCKKLVEKNYKHTVKCKSKRKCKIN